MSEGTGSKAAPEFEPPQACVGRIIKNVLPEHVQVTKDAKAAFTRAAGIFIFYLTHCANDFSRESKRSTIYTQDVANALKELDFGEFQGPLEAFIEAYRKEMNSKSKAKAVKSSSSSAVADGEDGEGDAEGEVDGDVEEGEGVANEDGDDDVAMDADGDDGEVDGDDGEVNETAGAGDEEDA